MNTDVINGVPRELKPCPFCGVPPTEYDQIGYSSVKCHGCKFSIKVRSEDGPPYAPELWNRRALLATAQPACDTCNGHGLIGGFVNAESGYESQRCPDCNAQPAAEGEREAFEAWAASVGYHTERDMFQREKYQSTLTWELWRVWQARAALSPAGGGVVMPDRETILQLFSENAECSDAGDLFGFVKVYERHAIAITKALVARLNAKPEAGQEVK